MPKQYYISRQNNKCSLCCDILTDASFCKRKQDPCQICETCLIKTGSKEHCPSCHGILDFSAKLPIKYQLECGNEIVNLSKLQLKLHINKCIICMRLEFITIKENNKVLEKQHIKYEKDVEEYAEWSNEKEMFQQDIILLNQKVVKLEDKYKNVLKKIKVKNEHIQFLYHKITRKNVIVLCMTIYFVFLLLFIIFLNYVN